MNLVLFCAAHQILLLPTYGYIYTSERDSGYAEFTPSFNALTTAGLRGVYRKSRGVRLTADVRRFYDLIPYDLREIAYDITWDIVPRRRYSTIPYPIPYDTVLDTVRSNGR